MTIARETSRDYQKPHRPGLVSAVNALGRVLARGGIFSADLSEASLIRTARERTGLHHFGDDTFRVRMRVLLSSMEEEASLHPIGRWMVRENLIRILSNRLRLQAALDRHPEILEQELKGPVVIAGLQRTGTTVVHRLLATDPFFRFLRAWEAINPAPLFPLPSPDRTDPRIRLAMMAERGVRYLAPDFFAIHPIEATGPEEDCLLFDYGFWSTVPEATMRVPSFSRWLERLDHTEAYLFFEKVLKTLSWQRPGRHWLLKTPQHLEHMDALINVFPSVRVIWTHRDPVTTLASFCSMICHSRGVFSDDIDPLEVGRHWSAKIERMIDLAISVREEVGQEYFMDVQYTELMADPMAQMRRIYEFVGLELDAEKKCRMEEWLRVNRQHKHGRHRYVLTDFGLDPVQVDSAFARYRDRFDIPRSVREEGAGSRR